jgi:hypothetical protein
MIDEKQFGKASSVGRKLLAQGPIAVAVSVSAGRVHVELNNGCAFIFPASQAQGLIGAKASALKQVEITSAGLSLYWPSLDVDLFVPALVKGVLGTRQWMAQIGSVGGKAVTPAKAISSRTNGKLGGRPRKSESATERRA